MSAPKPEAFSLVLTSLMKGVAYRENDPALWQQLLESQARVRDYVAPLQLELVLDEAEGYAYLRQRQLAEGEAELPRLVPRRPLSYPVSLLLALLRKKLAEFDAKSGETRLVLSLDEIVEMLRLFLPNTGNEAKLVDRVAQHVTKVVDLGFLRRLKGDDTRFEVRRIVKTFVDAQWLADFEQRLAEYRAHATSNLAETASEP
ncbi:MAG: DUF4194 domain-containing protein [Myxococcota bacterium]